MYMVALVLKAHPFLRHLPALRGTDLFGNGESRKNPRAASLSPLFLPDKNVLLGSVGAGVLPRFLQSYGYLCSLKSVAVSCNTHPHTRSG